MSRACRIRSVYSGLSLFQLGMRDISSGIDIRTKILDATTCTGEHSMVSYPENTTSGTELRCHKGIDISYQYADSFGFVREEVSELGKAPSVYLGTTMFSNRCPDVFQVFHDNLGYSLYGTIRDDLLGYVVVSPCSEPFLSARNDFEQSFRASSAFSLESSTQISVFPIHSIGILRRMESCGAGHCCVAYAEVDADGFSRNVNSCVWCFSFECEAEPVMTKFIGHEQSFSDLPEREVLQEAMRNVDRYSHTMVQYAQRQEEVSSIGINTSGSIKIVSDRTSIDNWLGFGLLHHATTLFDACNCALSWQCLPEFSVDVWMQDDIVLDAECPCRIDAMLQSDFVCGDEFVECSGLWQSDSRGCSQGRDVEQMSLYKANGFIQLHEVTSGFLHHLKMVVSSAQNI